MMVCSSSSGAGRTPESASAHKPGAEAFVRPGRGSQPEGGA